METSGYIAKENKDGTLTGIYCNNDSYVDWVGKVLFENYNTVEKVDELLNKGDTSKLEEKLEDCEFYEIDASEATTYENIEKLLNDWDCVGFLYIFKPTGKWVVIENYRNKRQLNLEDALQELKNVEHKIEKIVLDKPSNIAVCGKYYEDWIKSIGLCNDANFKQMRTISTGGAYPITIGKRGLGGMLINKMGGISLIQIKNAIDIKAASGEFIVTTFEAVKTVVINIGEYGSRIDGYIALLNENEETIGIVDLVRKRQDKSSEGEVVNV